MLGALTRILSSAGPPIEEEEPPPDFSPLDIAWSAAYWASDPGELFLNDDPVSIWSDTTGGARHLHDYSVGSNNPLYKSSVSGLNNQPAMLFNGTDDFLATSSTVWDGTGAWDTFIIFKQTSVNPGTYKIIVSTVTQSTFQPEFLTNVDNDWWMYAGGGSMSAGTPDTTAHAMLCRFNGASSDLVQDGTSIVTGNSGSWGLKDLCVAVRGTAGTFYWGGHIAFLGIKRGTLLTTQEHSDLVSWSRSFYGTP